MLQIGLPSLLVNASAGAEAAFKHVSTKIDKVILCSGAPHAFSSAITVLCAGIVSCIQRLFTRKLVSRNLVTLTRELVSGRILAFSGQRAAHYLLASAIWAAHPAVDPNTFQDTLTCGEL